MAEGGTKSTQCCGNSAGNASASSLTLHISAYVNDQVKLGKDIYIRPWSLSHDFCMYIPVVVQTKCAWH